MTRPRRAPRGRGRATVAGRPRRAARVRAPRLLVRVLQVSIVFEAAPYLPAQQERLRANAAVDVAASADRAADNRHPLIDSLHRGLEARVPGGAATPTRVTTCEQPHQHHPRCPQFRRNGDGWTNVRPHAGDLHYCTPGATSPKQRRIGVQRRRRHAAITLTFASTTDSRYEFQSSASSTIPTSN